MPMRQNYAQTTKGDKFCRLKITGNFSSKVMDEQSSRSSFSLDEVEKIASMVCIYH